MRSRLIVLAVLAGLAAAGAAFAAARPERHADGSGPLSAGGGETYAIDPSEAGADLARGFRLCLASDVAFARLEGVRPAVSLGRFEILGLALTPLASDAPLEALAPGFRPGLLAAPLAGGSCALLRVGLRGSAEGGGWDGLELDYRTADGRERTLVLDDATYVCGPALEPARCEASAP